MELRKIVGDENAVARLMFVLRDLVGDEIQVMALSEELAEPLCRRSNPRADCQSKADEA